MKVIDETLLEKMLDYIKTYQISYGQSPTYRNIMKHMSLKSSSIVYRYVEILCERGMLDKDEFGGIDISSNLSCDETIIAPIVGTVTCGAPILAQENIEGILKLPSSIFGKGEKFLLHAEGDSMIDAGIQSGDMLVVRKCEMAENGQIVVALIDDSATVKTFYKKNGYVLLHPENPKYDDIKVKNVQILGIVEHYIHKI